MFDSVVKNNCFLSFPKTLNVALLLRSLYCSKYFSCFGSKSFEKLRQNLLLTFLAFQFCFYPQFLSQLGPFRDHRRPLPIALGSAFRNFTFHDRLYLLVFPQVYPSGRTIYILYHRELFDNYLWALCSTCNRGNCSIILFLIENKIVHSRRGNTVFSYSWAKSKPARIGKLFVCSKLIFSVTKEIQITLACKYWDVKFWTRKCWLFICPKNYPGFCVSH